VVRARFFSHTKWATLVDRKRHLRDLVKIRPISRDPPPNPSATPASPSCSRPLWALWAGWDACNGRPLSENARGRRGCPGPGRRVERLGPLPTGEIWVCRKICPCRKPPPAPPLAPAPTSARPGGPPTAPPARPVGVWGPVRTPRGRYISSVGSVVVRTRGVPPHLPGYIYPSPWSSPATCRPRRRSMAPSAPARLLVNGRGPGGGSPVSEPAPTGQFRVCRKTTVCRKPPPYAHAPQRPRTPGPAQGPAVDWRVRPCLVAAWRLGCRPLCRQLHRSRLASAAAHVTPVPLRLPSPAPASPAPPPRAEDAGTSGGGRQHAPAVGPSAWPGASRLIIPLPTRPLRLARYAWPAAAVNLPAGRRWPGGFSPHYILSDPIWVGKCPACLKVYQKFSWGRP
jgi:hypothetical protein